MQSSESGDNEKKAGNSDVIFFLGAGASVKAGVPATKQFIFAKKSKEGYDGFLEEINNNGNKKEKDALKWIIDNLKKWKRRELDVELLLEILHKANTRQDEVLLSLYSGPMWFKHDEGLKKLEPQLRQFIREQTIVDEEKIDYLEPLKDFISGDRSLNIFSVNYDTCIEQFCKRYELEYTDGFELYWNSKLFVEGKHGVSHYKLHGSIMWYLTDRNTYVKIPIASDEGDTIKLITGETAENLMVYPMESKLAYSEPLSELTRMLRKTLEKTKICIVVGYSFRDKYIKQIFFEAARKNRTLILYLIDPCAGKIYDTALKFSDTDKENELKSSDVDKEIPSPLNGRVICWNYPVENILRDYYLYQKIDKSSTIYTLYEEAEKNKRKGYDGRCVLQDCVMNCLDVGYISRAEAILEKDLEILSLRHLTNSSLFKDDNLGRNREYVNKFKIYYMLGTYHLLNGNYKNSKRYFEELRYVLNESLEVGLKCFDLYNQPGSPEIHEKRKDLGDKYISFPFYKWCMGNSGWEIYLGDLSKFLKQQINLLKTDQDDKNNHACLKNFSDIVNRCELMKTFLETDNERYINNRKIDGLNMEIDRKEDLEKALIDLVKSFDDLINLCDKNVNPDKKR